MTPVITIDQAPRVTASPGGSGPRTSMTTGRQR